MRVCVGVSVLARLRVILATQPSPYSREINSIAFDCGIDPLSSFHKRFPWRGRPPCTSSMYPSLAYDTAESLGLGYDNPLAEPSFQPLFQDYFGMDNPAAPTSDGLATSLGLSAPSAGFEDRFVSDEALALELFLPKSSTPGENDPFGEDPPLLPTPTAAPVPASAPPLLLPTPASAPAPAPVPKGSDSPLATDGVASMQKTSEPVAPASPGMPACDHCKVSEPVMFTKTENGRRKAFCGSCCLLEVDLDAETLRAESAVHPATAQDSGMIETPARDAYGRGRLRRLGGHKRPGSVFYWPENGRSARRRAAEGAK